MEIAIGIIGLLIAWFTYQKTFLAEPKEEKENLLAHFRANQALSKEVLQKLTAYGHKYNAFNQEIFAGVQLESYINTMREEHAKNLSDELFDKIKNMKLTKSNIESMTESILTQQRELITLQTSLKMYLQK